MLAALRRLTLAQWRIIDETYLKRSPTHWRVPVVLLTVAACLILPRYFGRADFFERLPAMRAWMAHSAYPTLWPRLYWAGFKAINYLLVPMLVVRFVLRERVRDYGFGIRGKGKAWALYGAMFAVVLPLTYAASLSPAFAATYPKYADAGRTWTQLLLWESAYGFQFFALEFFFRGFILFALAPHLGSSAIFVALVPYTMIHFAKPLAETVGSVIAGIALGTMALRTRSIYGGVVLHCAVAWSMDLFVLWHRGALPRVP